MNELDAQPLSGEPAARVLVAGASGFTGALAAQIVWRHPRLRAGRGHLAQRRRQAARQPLPALPGAAGADRARPRPGRRHRRRDRRLPAWGRGADRRRAARPRASLVVDLSADFRLRDMDDLRALVRRARRARAVRHRRLRADRDVPRGAARGEAGRHPRLLPDRERARPGAAGRKGPARRRRRQRHAGRLRRRARRRRPIHYAAMDENAFPYKTEGHRHRPEIEQELAALGSPAPVTFVPHLLPLDQGELASCYAQTTEPISKEAVQALYRERYADEPFVRVVDRPPGLRDAARHQRVPRLRHRRGARPGDGLLGDRQPLEGRLRPGRAEPQPDARPGRDEGCVSASPRCAAERPERSSGRAGSRRRRGSRSSTPPSWRPASAPAAPTAASRAAARPTSACSSATRSRSARRWC